MKPSLSIFFPAYNDAGTIASLALVAHMTARQVTDDYEVIVVNDASPDHTGELLDEMARTYPWLKVVHHPQHTRDVVLVDVGDADEVEPAAGGRDLAQRGRDVPRVGPAHPAVDEDPRAVGRGEQHAVALVGLEHAQLHVTSSRTRISTACSTQRSASIAPAPASSYQEKSAPGSGCAQRRMMPPTWAPVSCGFAASISATTPAT